MNTDYYTLPLKTIDFITNKSHSVCVINESIAHHIHLINTTYFGECTFDESFGCSIWNIDFDNLKSLNKLKELINDSLINSLKRHEKRLTKIAVDVKIIQEEISEAKIANRIKKKVNINIKGKIKKTNENFSYVEYFYIGPLSY